MKQWHQMKQTYQGENADRFFVYMLISLFDVKSRVEIGSLFNMPFSFWHLYLQGKLMDVLKDLFSCGCRKWPKSRIMHQVLHYYRNSSRKRDFISGHSSQYEPCAAKAQRPTCFYLSLGNLVKLGLIWLFVNKAWFTRKPKNQSSCLHKLQYIFKHIATCKSNFYIWGLVEGLIEHWTTHSETEIKHANRWTPTFSFCCSMPSFGTYYIAGFVWMSGWKHLNSIMLQSNVKRG